MPPFINIEKVSFETVSSVFKVLNTLRPNDIIVYAKCIRLVDLVTDPGHFSWKELPGMSYTGRGNLIRMVKTCPTVYSRVAIIKNGDQHYVYIEPTSLTDNSAIARANEALDLCCNQLMHTNHPIGCDRMPEVTSRHSFDDDDVESELPICVSDALPMRKYSKCIDF